MNLIKGLALAVSAFGSLISSALLAEYYGASVSAAEALCRRGDSGLDNCAIVSMSDYSAISGVPLLGNIPVALMGFVFFGFICILIILSFRKTDDKNRESEIFSLALSLSAAAFIINIVLYLISKYIIKIVCPLCVITYICVIILLPLFFLLLPYRGGGIRSLLMSIFKNSFYSIKNNIIKYGSVFFALAAFGFALGVFVFLPAESSYADMDRDEKVTALIRIYEKAEPVELTVSSRTMSGDRNAPVEVVIVHDFTCPYCVTAGTLFERMRKTYPGLFRIYYITIPISGTCGELPEGENHPFADACIAALGTACAIDQKRFRVMYENLYSDFINGVRHSRESVKRIAEANRFDMERFNRCFVSPEAQRFVRANLTQSENVGVTAIPTIFIDGRKMPGIINNEGVLQGFLEYLKLRKGR